MGSRLVVVVVAMLAATPLGVRGQEARLVLTHEDIPGVRSFASNLRSAAAKGAGRAQAFLGAKATKAPLMKQNLYNVSVALTAIKVEEQLDELQKLGLDKDPSSEYAKRVAETRKELDDLTAPFRAARASDGRTALEVNKTIVRANLAAVEKALADIHSVDAASLPQ